MFHHRNKEIRYDLKKEVGYNQFVKRKKIISWTQMQFAILFSVLLHCLKLKMISIFHTLMQGKRVYCDPDTVLCKASSQVWETDVEAGEGGRWGKGGEVDRVSGSSERHCGAHTFFSLYSCKCLSACILHRGAWCWHHSSAWNMPLHVWRNDRMIQSQIYAAEQKLEGKEFVKYTHSH